MDNNTNSSTESARRIDLKSMTEVQYWCRIFDVSPDELRVAVHQAGHEVEAVERYLRNKRNPGG